MPSDLCISRPSSAINVAKPKIVSVGGRRSSTVLIASKEMPEPVAYIVTKTIIENKDALVRGHAGLAEFGGGEQGRARQRLLPPAGEQQARDQRPAPDRPGVDQARGLLVPTGVVRGAELLLDRLHLLRQEIINTGVIRSPDVRYYPVSLDRFIREILDSSVILIVPSQNPDGRERFAEQRAQELLREVRALKPTHGGRPLGTITASIGLAVYPQHGAVPALITHAGVAVRAAKAAGGARS